MNKQPYRIVDQESTVGRRALANWPAKDCQLNLADGALVMLKRVIAAAVLAALMAVFVPTETHAVVDIYRDVVECANSGDIESGGLACSEYTIWAFGVGTGLACAKAATISGYFSGGFMWYVGGAYCGVLTTL